MMARYFSGGVFGVPRNIRCSKKCANPDLPGSNSLLEPVWTGTSMLTRLGNPVGTTITFRPLGSVRSVAAKGRMSVDEEARCAGACAASMPVRARRMSAEAKDRGCMRGSPDSAEAGCDLLGTDHLMVPAW